MKTKNLTNPIFLLLLLLGALWSGCGTIDDNDPCPEEDWVYDIKPLNHEYDSLFPYDGTQKTLTYLYSNDTIEGDTLVFELYKTDTMEVTGNSWSGGGGGCTVFADEVKRYYYKESKYSKILKAEFFDEERIGVNIINEGDDFEPDNVISNGGIVGRYYFDSSNKDRFRTVNFANKKYFYSHCGSGVYFQSHVCAGDSYSNCFNTRFGLLNVTNTCNNETFTLLNN
jgi:hypothetical protein